MKRYLIIFASVVIAAINCGCAHGQPAPSPNPVVGWTWNLASGAQPTWTTTLYVAVVASTSTPAPTPGGSVYHSVGTVAGNITTFSDSNEAPGTVIYALTQNSTTSGCGTGGTQPCYSAYSPVSTAFSVPPLPTAPGSPTPNLTTAMLAPSKGMSPHAPTVAFRGVMPTPKTPVLTAEKAGI